MQEQQSMTTEFYFVGKMHSIFFEAQDSFYKVGAFSVEENNFEWHEPEIVVTGSFGDLQEGMTYRIIGHLVKHARYGQQFQVTSYQNQGTSTENGLINYLSSPLFQGIGKKTAQKIVELLGIEAISLILADPSVLMPLKLKKDKLTSFVEQLQKNNGIEQIIIGLAQFGFTANMATTIYETYRDDALKIIKDNPYQLVEDIEGISFQKADQIAQLVGIPLDADIRIGASIISVLTSQSFSSGDTYQDVNLVLKESQKLLRNNKIVIDQENIQMVLLEFAQSKKIIAEGTHVYLADLYHAEWNIAEHLKRLTKAGISKKFSTSEITEALTSVEKMLNVKYDLSQRKAIIAAINEPLFILTGGPGTGKTTIINGFVGTFALLNEVDLDTNAYKKEPELPILLAAPTGRAAKRLSESTKLPARTVHRLLGMTGREKNKVPEVEDLKGRLLIIDEMSMIDTQLFDILVAAVPLKMQILLVGDKDQLPSVGPGQVFADLLQSKAFMQMELTHIHRQAQESSIIPLAHAVKQGKIPEDLVNNKTDRSFLFARTNQVSQIVKQVIQKAYEKGFKDTDIQILAPMYRGVAGIDHLNRLVQDVVNPLNVHKRRQVEFNNQVFRVGDKVLQLVNSPESNIFNGDIGKIVAINLAKDVGNDTKTDELIISFESGEVTYPRSDWQRLTLAYAISIHKAQGSEFEVVILPLVNAYSVMLQRNLLYTGLTRASKKLVIIGEPTAFAKAVNQLGANRQTTLAQRITAVYQKTTLNEEAKLGLVANSNTKTDTVTKSLDETVNVYTVKPKQEIEKRIDHDNKLAWTTNYRLTIKNVDDQDIDPLIGLNDLSPFDFMK